MNRQLTRAGALLACALGLAFAAPAPAAAAPAIESVSAHLGHGQTVAGGCESLEAGNLYEVYRNGGCEDRTLAANGLTHRTAKALSPTTVISWRPSKEGYAEYVRQFGEAAPTSAAPEVVAPMPLPAPPAEVIVVTETPAWVYGLVALFGLAALAFGILLARSAQRERELKDALDRVNRAPLSRPFEGHGGRHVVIPEDQKVAAMLAELDAIKSAPQPDLKRLDEIVTQLVAAKRITQLPSAKKTFKAKYVPDAQSAAERTIVVERAELRRLNQPTMNFRKFPWEGWRIGDTEKAIEREIFRNRGKVAHYLGRAVRIDEQDIGKRKRFDEFFESDLDDAMLLTRRAPAHVH